MLGGGGVSSEQPPSLSLRPRGWKAGASRAEPAVGTVPKRPSQPGLPSVPCGWPWPLEGIPHVSACSTWSLAALTSACWGLGWDWRYDNSRVAFRITKCQCLVGFRLLGASKDKNNLHHRLTRSSGWLTPPAPSTPHSPQVESPAMRLRGSPLSPTAQCLERARMSPTLFSSLNALRPGTIG